MNKIIVLRISDDNSVLLDGVTLNSTNDVAEVLEELRAKNPDATISIEANDSTNYEAIGKAIYGTQRTGFNVEHLRIFVGGKLLGT